MNKIIIFDPATLNMSIPAYYNVQIEKILTDDSVDKITFIFSDLYQNLKQPMEFINDYIDFMSEWSLPYVFFPYYTFFNKNLHNICWRPTPLLEATINAKNTTINFIANPANGFLILDLTALKSINFRFNEQYTNLYYIQDMIQKYYENKLWISNCCYIDRLNSFNDLKENTVAGFHLTNSEELNKERKAYESHGYTYHNLQDALDLFREKYQV